MSQARPDPDDWPPSALAVYDAVADADGPVTSADLVEDLPYARTTVSSRLGELVDAGEIQRREVVERPQTKKYAIRPERDP